MLYLYFYIFDKIKKEKKYKKIQKPLDKVKKILYNTRIKRKKSV